MDNTQYNLLYSLYSWPNVILSLIGGVLIDRWIGVRIGTVLFSVLVTLGQVYLLHVCLEIFLLFFQLVFALGGIFDSFVVMLIGRFIFG